jgi:hypothetical protein
LVFLPWKSCAESGGFFHSFHNGLKVVDKHRFFHRVIHNCVDQINAGFEA